MEDDAERPPPRRVRPTSISSMSQLLLQGWAMLADACPECGVPLMRHPEGTELLCTNCGRDTTAAAPQRAATAAPSQAAEAQPASHQERLANGTGSSAGASSGDDEPGLVQPPPPLRERLQAEVAAPAAAAPSVPAPSTAAAPHHAGTSSGAAWLRQAAASSGSGAAQQAAQHARPLPARAPPQPRAGGQASQGGQGEASKAIAELMLEGWALLQEHCPRCLNPLLRSRDRQRIYCAACQMFAVREGEQSAAQPAAAATESAQPSAAAPLPSASSPAAAAPQTPAAAPAALPAAQHAAPPLHQHLPAVDAAASAVAARLAGLTTALQAAEPSAADEAAHQLVAELRNCAATLKALAEARHALSPHHAH